MGLSRVVGAVLIVLSIVFLSFQIYGLEAEAAGVRTLLFIFLLILYYIKVDTKLLYFFLFLITFTGAEIVNFIAWLVAPITIKTILYYIGNSLYILAYSLLIVQIVSTMNFKDIVKKLPYHLIILIVLDVFCVIVITNTVIGRLNYYEYFVELIYNSVIMILLTVTLINYIYRDDKKAINLLTGAMCIFFSEVIQLAYFYVSNINLLNVLCSLFLVLAFVFFYLQSTLTYDSHEESIYRDSLI